jgi:hypothetical protein
MMRFFKRARWDRERARELDAYVQIETGENIARGMTQQEASGAARRKLDNRTQIREEILPASQLGSDRREDYGDSLSRSYMESSRAIREISRSRRCCCSRSPESRRPCPRSAPRESIPYKRCGTNKNQSAAPKQYIVVRVRT